MRDDVVPVEFSRRYAARRPHITLQLFNSGHELTDVLEPMWSRICQFLDLGRAGPAS
jgi:hypothetical protein